MATFLRTLRDGLINLATGTGTTADPRTHRRYFSTIMDEASAVAAFRGSGMLRKVVTIPATDMTREWRDWQVENAEIELIEAEEKRLSIRDKVRQAETYRGLGGGAIILGLPGLPEDPVDWTRIGKGQLTYVNVVSRWQIQLGDFEDDAASDRFGMPKWFILQSGGTPQKVHPDRIVCFRAEPVPMAAGVTQEDHFWGDGVIKRCYEAAQNLDDTLANFSALVGKARTTIIGIPGLLDYAATADGMALLQQRTSAMMLGEGSFAATLYDAGKNGQDAEKIEHRQVTFTGIPEVIRVNAEALSAVSDIPMTRLWGKAAEGMSASGDSQQRDWNKMVKGRQENDLRPCLDRIDRALVPSAVGKQLDASYYEFAPLDTPTQEAETTRFKTFTEALEKLQSMAVIPDAEFNRAAQTTVIENGWLPGLDAALADMPDDERYGMAQASETESMGGDPVSIAVAGLNDAAPRPLYVQRKLLNAADLIAWAKANGIATTLPADDMHVTILYSRAPVDPLKMGETWASEPDGGLVVKAGGPRAVERLGENAVVLSFVSWSLSQRHRDMVEAGASHDWPEYQPHVTLSLTVPADTDLDAIKPYAGELRFGPELFEPLDLDWKAKVEEA